MSQSCSLQSTWKLMIRDGLLAGLLALALCFAIRAEFTPASVQHPEPIVAQRARPDLCAAP